MPSMAELIAQAEPAQSDEGAEILENLPSPESSAPEDDVPGMREAVTNMAIAVAGLDDAMTEYPTNDYINGRARMMVQAAWFDLYRAMAEESA
jgi:hypothetical protein